MKTMLRALIGAAIGLGLFAGGIAPMAAQEVPTGAARIVSKVEYRIAVSKVSLLMEVERIKGAAERMAP
ncbi:MAG: hypothetical protein IT338_00445 [Thermomicrobiales bacterium]|nr:hypothetical protein [Thermomicrobiales bacterium]